MSIIMILSIAIKGVAALLEFLIQYLITQQLGVPGYGDYAFYINIIDISFWVLFSGIVKSNTYYLSDIVVSIRQFKRKYYTLYVLPVFAATLVTVAFLKDPALLLAPVIVIPYLFMMDNSSELLARGKYMDSLLGEYLIGRITLVAALLLFIFTNQKSVALLVALYGLQFLVVLIWFRGRKESIRPRNVCEERVSFKKLWRYQQSDMETGLVGQSPIILQHLFVGSYEAGFTAIVVLAKKLVGFIAGPTAKVFLPQFSRLYKQEKIDEIRVLFKHIMQMQMLFVSAIAVVLLGFTKLVLSIFSPGLLKFSILFKMVSAGFLLSASLGPSGGLLQMTGNEKAENRLCWGSAAVMVLVWFIMRGNRLFALYGMCAQALTEGISKYVYVCNWFKNLPMPVWQYVLLWIPTAAISAIVIWRGLGTSFLAMLLAVVCTVILTGAIQLCDRATREKARGLWRNWKNKVLLV